MSTTAATMFAPLALPHPTSPAEPRSVYHAAKRATDVALAAVLLVALAPVFAVVALLIKLTDRGPVLFVQRRVGRHGAEFPFLKFRSMVPQAEALQASLAAANDHGPSVTFKMKRDPRVTWVGRIIRKTSLDELPQLVNVVRGEMSLVGPRPAVPREVAQYNSHHRQRLGVTPGLTGLWQVAGRGDIPFDRQVELDLEYIRRRSLAYDLTLLARTVPAVLTGRGAY